MQQWEYKTVRVLTVRVLDHRKRVVQEYLDPDIADWESYCRERRDSDGRSYWSTALAGSPRGVWTTLPRCLDELGGDCWELAGATPPLFLGGMVAQDTEFCLLFKRPRQGDPSREPSGDP